MKSLHAALGIASLLTVPANGQSIVNQINHSAFAGGVAFDSISDEVIVFDSTDDDVTFYDRATGVVNSSFAAPSTSIIGGHADISTGNLWICDESEMVFEVDRAGNVLGSWSAQPVITDASALTLDPCSDTVWISNDSGNIVAEFTRAGAPTGNQFAPAGSVDGDGCVYDPVTRTFLMGEDTGDQILIVDRNGASVATIPLGGLGISPEGLALDTITGNVFIGNGLTSPRAVFEVSGILNPAPAGAVVRYGTNCGARIAISDPLDDDGRTCAGAWLGYQSAAAPGNLAVLWFGTFQVSFPLASVGSNCSIYAAPTLFPLSSPTNANGRTGLRMPIPPGASGFQINVWGADVSSLPPFVNNASEGLQFVIQ